MIKNLEGKQFGRLTVLRMVDKGWWECECSCEAHTHITIRGCELVSGNVRSCGCLYHESRIEVGKKSVKDLTGQRFGKLLVQKRVNNIDNCVAYECLCDCGNTKIVKASNLRNGSTKTCGMCEKDTTPVNVGDVFGSWTVNYLLRKNGRKYANVTCVCGNTKDMVLYNLKKLRDLDNRCRCSRRGVNIKDKTGMRIGKLTVLGFDGMGKHHANWKCKCDCGNITVVDGSSLATGATKSCGSCTHVSFEQEKLRNLCEESTGYKFTPNRIVLDGKEIDLYCDELKLGIEYNGSIFHASENGVYRNKPKYAHRDKFLLAREKGIHLINVFDVDLQEKGDKIRQYITELCLAKTKLYARNCDVMPIDRLTAHNFCDTYHLQNHANNDSIYYGLYYNDDLVSVMTFGVRRYSNNHDEYELYRYVTKSGYVVVGGASKLLRYFEVNNAPSLLISYSDNDYFLGSMYEKLGFNYSGQCSVSYYWFLTNRKLARERCQVNKLKVEYPELYIEAIENSAVNKEDYIMQRLGACKVYRSGNTRWVKEYV